MAIDTPSDWGQRTWVEDTPLGHLQTVNSVGNPVRWEVAQWESTREIASTSLPGQARHKTGLSVGTGRALVKRQPKDFPWKQSLVYELTGQDGQILLAPEGHTEIPTGQFQVAEVSGDLTTLGVQVELDERTIQGRDKAANVRGWDYDDVLNFPPDEPPEVDPSWWIAELARQLGYDVGTLEPGSNGYSPFLDVPFQGSLTPAYPADLSYFTNDGDRLSWTDLDGRLAASNGEFGTSNSSVLMRYQTDAPLRASITLTMDLREDMEFQWDDISGGGADITCRIQAPEGSDTVRVGLTLTPRNWTGGVISISNTSFTFPRDPANPYRVQAQLEVFATGENWTSARARVRRGAGSPAWSAWVTKTPEANGDGTVGSITDDFRTFITIDGGFTNDPRPAISRLSVVDNTNANNTMTLDAILAASAPNGKRLYLEPLLGAIRSPWLDPDLSTWGAMQEIVEAWQGALITDVYGNLRVLNRLTLTGVGGAETSIDVGLRFEDIPWAMNASDQADRLTLTYRPANVVTVFDGSVTKLPIVWEAQDVIPARVGGNDVFFNTEYLYLMYTAQMPWVQKNSPEYNEIYHTWDAHRNSSGNGTALTPNTDVGIRIEQVTVSTWKVYIDNRTTSTFYMVDETGAPWLKVRSFYHLDQTQEAVIERGASAGEAMNPISIDVSNYVQNADDANALADFIWARVNQRSWRASTVNTIPDYRLDLGDVVELHHSRTGMKSNALITKVELAGEPGSLTQKIDLVLIPPTWEDFDEAWAAFQPNPPGSWDEFDALWGPPAPSYTWDDFDRAPTATTVAEIEEALR